MRNNPASGPDVGKERIRLPVRTPEIQEIRLPVKTSEIQEIPASGPGIENDGEEYVRYIDPWN